MKGSNGRQRDHTTTSILFSFESVTSFFIGECVRVLSALSLPESLLVLSSFLTARCFFFRGIRGFFSSAALKLSAFSSSKWHSTIRRRCSIFFSDESLIFSFISFSTPSFFSLFHASCSYTNNFIRNKLQDKLFRTDVPVFDHCPLNNRS